MMKTCVVMGLALAAALVAACSSGPTTYTINGSCGPLAAEISSEILLSGPCNLGPAGQYTLDAGLAVNIGACGNEPVTIAAQWIQGSSYINSSFTGAAVIGCKPNDGGTDLTQPITVAGVFTYSGGTGTFSDATGTAAVDGGVTASNTGLTATLGLTGTLTY
ncbi:MAG: hypothetical protein ACLQDQ_16150 [Myxococcaceae bacterium]